MYVLVWSLHKHSSTFLLHHGVGTHSSFSHHWDLVASSILLGIKTVWWCTSQIHLSQMLLWHQCLDFILAHLDILFVWLAVLILFAFISLIFWIVTFSVDLYMSVMFNLYNESVKFDYQFKELDFVQLALYCLDTGGLGHINVGLSLFHIKSMSRPKHAECGCLTNSWGTLT